MSQEIAVAVNPFDTLRQTHLNGDEFWSARDLQELLGYSEWRKFEDALGRAMTACKNSGQDAENHFVLAAKMVAIGYGNHREVTDYHLSRYACYLLAMNSDSRKSQVALAQTYFAVRTREAEIAQEQFKLPRNYIEALEALVASEKKKERLTLENAQQEAKILADAPKIEAWERAKNLTGVFGLQDGFKILGLAPNLAIKQLRADGYLMRDNIPYQVYIERGWFVVKEVENPKTGRMYTQAMFTPKGLGEVGERYCRMAHLSDVPKVRKSAA